MTGTREIATIASSSDFDPDWYSATYPDVALAGMDPAEHYLRYGRLLNRDPAPHLNLRFARVLYRIPPEEDPLAFLARHRARTGGRLNPDIRRVLIAASEVAAAGLHDRAIALALSLLPPELYYSVNVLRANAALRRGDEDGWLDYLCRYLGHFGDMPLRLEGEGTVFDRLSAPAGPAVPDGPLISVIMPSWNAEGTLRKAAASILAQTWRNLELIIIDDASEDGTWAVMQGIAARDPRVRIYRNAVNVGPYVSKNIGVTLARGEWITGHDADDWAVPVRLEQHMKAVMEAGRDTMPASITCMIRMFATGELDRFSQIASYSLDGLCRIAPISCLFDATFLRDRLGGWDNIRFGADSEMIARIERVTGKQITTFPMVSMFCLSHEESLTNHREFGVDRLTGASDVRRRYAAAWGSWHKEISPGDEAARLAFPPSADQARPFPAPDECRVPAADILRNHAVLTGADPALDQPVTAICASRRPQFLAHVAAQLTQQTHRPLHVIFVAHGKGHDLAAIERAFSGVTSITLIDLPDPDATLGEALNRALELCQTDLVTKIDDDDFYGPDYVRRTLAAFFCNGHEGVGIVGRGQAYCYVEDGDALVLRFGSHYRNCIRPQVFGGTIFWSRAALDDQRFAALPRADDTAFFKAAVEKDVKVFSCEPFDYVHVRYADPSAHTWKIETSEFLRPAKEVAKGLRLDIVYSTPRSSVPDELPGIEPKPGQMTGATELEPVHGLAPPDQS